MSDTTEFEVDAMIARYGFYQTGCDYCDEYIPVVCGDCGHPEYPPEIDPFSPEALHKHRFRPVHRIEDPEGIKGRAVVPCTRGHDGP